jgi:outer membrane lipase/esterase
MVTWKSCRRAAVLAATLLAAWLQTSCGGGTSQIEPFQARQVIVLGDDYSVLQADAKHFSINYLDANGVFDCGQYAIWTQIVVANFGLSQDRCPNASLGSGGITRGAPGAKAADLDAQIDAQIAAGALTSKDLFLLMIGVNDIIEIYEQSLGADEAAARGRHVAEQINRLINGGARVIVSTLPDLGLTPYARAKDAASPGQAAVLTELTAAYNARVRVDIVQDGRSIGLILADDLSLAMTRNPSLYLLSNVTDAACTTAVPDCTTSTLVAGATGTTHLWADDRRFGPIAQSQLANLAINRARNNPF